jgi:hypothetical protein
MRGMREDVCADINKYVQKGVLGKTALLHYLLLVYTRVHACYAIRYKGRENQCAYLQVMRSVTYMLNAVIAEMHEIALIRATG